MDLKLLQAVDHAELTSEHMLGGKLPAIKAALGIPAADSFAAVKVWNDLMRLVALGYVERNRLFPAPVSGPGGRAYWVFRLTNPGHAHLRPLRKAA